ncbi:MAG: carbamoyltransferase HypF, partial [Cytophagaceae bacterium]|nr:carbamoyltransferase HypF [Gemmatimonadaceae bacterium]
MTDDARIVAAALRVRGTVQGVGFRPFVHRVALAYGLAGWVRNTDAGVSIHVEGRQGDVEQCLHALRTQAPAAAVVAHLDVDWVSPAHCRGFVIHESSPGGSSTTRISPDLATCAACLRELQDPADARFGYPYINCTDCGPRYSIITGLPYDRGATTMAPWAMDARCRAEYVDPSNRRFHAQPLACPTCGPHYALVHDHARIEGALEVVETAVALLRAGRILAVKGIGGYHLSCDARNAAAVRALRERKFRKEKPFAMMVRDLEVAAGLASLGEDDVALLQGVARPIVLVPARVVLEGVAPDTGELGLMLPYAPLHHLLFAAGAPDALVMTSAN